MKIIEPEVVCINRFASENIYYIFRNNGVEVTVVIFENDFTANKTLTDLEIEFIKKNLL